jgi:hypothetical protein
MKRLLAYLLLALGAVSCTGISVTPTDKRGADPMKATKDSNKVMFSEVSGRVLLDGKPVSTQEIRQNFSWLGVDDGDATTLTDDDGWYHFPAVYSRRKQPRGEKDIFISQTISTRHDERTITLWSTTKYDFLDRGELGGHPIRMEHELTGESRNYMIPSLGEYRTNLDGVLKLDHPYAHDLERGQALVDASRKELTRQLLEALNAPALLELINRQLVHPMLLPNPASAVDGITGLEFSGFSLYGDAGHTKVSATSYGYIGFTIAGRLSIRDTGGTVRDVPFYWPKASLALTVSVDTTVKLAGTFEALQVYAGDIHLADSGRYMQRETIGNLVYEIITTRPPTELAYMLDHRLAVADLVYDERELPQRYTPGYRITDFSIDAITPSYVKVEENYVSLQVSGRFSVDGHPNSYAFTADLCLSLASLSEGGCELVENGDCRFSVAIPTFGYALRMERSELSADDPLIMHFTVTNLLPKTNVFLIWHTPLEGFRNEFLDIVHVESGEVVEYEGILASRTAPSRENGSFIELAAGGSRSTTIDLRGAYTFTRPGTYRVAFRRLGGWDDENPASTEFVLHDRP